MHIIKAIRNTPNSHEQNSNGITPVKFTSGKSTFVYKLHEKKLTTSDTVQLMTNAQNFALTTSLIANPLENGIINVPFISSFPKVL